MADMNVLDELGTQMDSVDTMGGEDAKRTRSEQRRAERTKKIAEMKQCMNESLSEDPTLADRIGRLSKMFEVTHTLGYGDKGGLIEKSKAADGKERTFEAVSAIVGYVIKNCSDQKMTYLTEEFVKNSEGVWEGSRVEKTVEPGKEFMLTRPFMTVFASTPEISFTLSNGKIVRGSRKVEPGDVTGELSAYYFTFDDENMNVNDDVNVKKNISTLVDGKWLVKPEYQATFGYLENATEKAPSARQKSSAFTAQAYAANFVQKMLKAQQ